MKNGYCIDLNISVSYNFIIHFFRFLDDFYCIILVFLIFFPYIFFKLFIILKIYFNIYIISFISVYFRNFYYSFGVLFVLKMNFIIILIIKIVETCLKLEILLLNIL